MCLRSNPFTSIGPGKRIMLQYPNLGDAGFKYDFFREGVQRTPSRKNHTLNQQRPNLNA